VYVVVVVNDDVVVVVGVDGQECTARLLRPNVADRKRALYDVVFQILSLRVCRFGVRVNIGYKTSVNCSSGSTI